MRTGFSAGKLVQGQQFMRADGLLSSSHLNLRRLLSHAYRRVCPLETPAFGLNVEQGVDEEWDYSTDLANMTVEQFRNYEGFKNKSSPSMMHDELATILLPNQLVTEFKYLGTGSYIKMAPQYWTELFKIRAKSTEKVDNGSQRVPGTTILMLGGSLRGLFLAQSVLGIPLEQVTKSPGYCDVTPLTKLTLGQVKSVHSKAHSRVKHAATKEEAISRLLGEIADPGYQEPETQTERMNNIRLEKEDMEEGNTQSSSLYTYVKELLSSSPATNTNHSPGYFTSSYQSPNIFWYLDIWSDR